ncbi:hypothetical protein J4439_02420 [Candidatus Woesearchaeota archaeon]|nr:hypothetical protein [Candidatus Woesearchaeota archaeon]
MQDQRDLEKLVETFADAEERIPPIERAALAVRDGAAAAYHSVLGGFKAAYHGLDNALLSLHEKALSTWQRFAFRDPGTLSRALYLGASAAWAASGYINSGSVLAYANAGMAMLLGILPQTPRKRDDWISRAADLGLYAIGALSFIGAGAGALSGQAQYLPFTGIGLWTWASAGYVRRARSSELDRKDFGVP